MPRFGGAFFVPLRGQCSPRESNIRYLFGEKPRFGIE